MGVTEYERHRLFTWFEEQMGEERASTLMDMLPTTGFGDLATKHDLGIVKHDLTHELGIVKHDLVAMESRITTKVIGWILASQAVTLSVIGTLISVR